MDNTNGKRDRVPHVGFRQARLLLDASSGHGHLVAAGGAARARMQRRQDKRQRQKAEAAFDAVLTVAHQREHEIRGVLAGARAVLEQDDLASAVRAVVAIACDLTGAALGYVAIQSEGDDEPFVFVQSNEGQSVSHGVAPIPWKELHAELYRSRQMVIENQFPQSSWAASLPPGYPAVDNLVLAPLLAGDKAVGTIGLANKPEPFGPREVALVEALGELVALALRNARQRDRLLKSEERYRRLIEMSPDAIFLYAAGKFAYLNPAALAALGAKSPEDLAGKSIFDLIPSDTHELVQERLAALLMRREAVPIVEHRYLRLDGAIAELETVGAPCDVNGEPGAIVVARDITARKQDAARLREATEYLEKIFTFGNAPMIIWDGALVVRRFNRAFEALTGLQASEVVGKKLECLLPAQNRAHAMEIVHQMLRGERLETAEVPVRGCDGHTRTLLFSSANVVGADGAVEATIAQGVDVTEWQLVQGALQESERRFRDMLESLEEIAVIIDARGKILFANGYLLRLTGWKMTEVLCRDWFDTFLPETLREDIRRQFMKAMAGEQSFPPHMENVIVTRDHVERHITWDNTVLRDAKGNSLGFASLGRDVTEQRELERKLQHTQKMQAVGQLAGGVAHDFNNVLQVVAGYTDLLLKQFGPGKPGHHEVQSIVKATERAGRLVNQLLTFSRQEPPSSKPLNLNTLIVGLALMLRRIIGEHIELGLELAEDLPTVMGDPGQLEQVLMNLCVNARDAMPDGGSIRIRTHLTELDEADVLGHPGRLAGPHVLLSVTDTGIGMAREVVERIFEPFFTTKGAGKGTGLGLATVYGIVQRHSGIVTCASSPGKGAAFHIHFPAAEDADIQEEPVCETTASIRCGTETLLLAEDDHLVRDLARRMLTSGGYRVLVAKDGPEALDLYEKRESEIDLVLLDVVMPGMSGKAVADIIRARNETVPILFSSGYDASMLERTLSAEELAAVIRKPYMQVELLARVRRVLDAHEP